MFNLALTILVPAVLFDCIITYYGVRKIGIEHEGNKSVRNLYAKLGYVGIFIPNILILSIICILYLAVRQPLNSFNDTLLSIEYFGIAAWRFYGGSTWIPTLFLHRNKSD